MNVPPRRRLNWAYERDAVHESNWAHEPKENELPPRIPVPSYRHASPSGPWPWMNIEPESDAMQLATPRTLRSPDCSHTTGDCRCWDEYPRSLFSNWTEAQVKRSGIKDMVAGSHTCVIHHVDVDDDGRFSVTERHTAPPNEDEKFWQLMYKDRSQNTRARALFVESLSVPVMQMLGTKYNIEPFFFSSSLNWIPSRYQEELRPGEGDHITITLTFLRSIKEPVRNGKRRGSTASLRADKRRLSAAERRIDTQLPLPLRSDDENRNFDESLLLDLLAIHMVRTSGSSTLISYHPSHDRRVPSQPHTSAKRLHSRIGLAGHSVYWQQIFKNSDDPTFVLLIMLWYALYAWDEAFETLWGYISQLEYDVISTNNMRFTHELHKIRAHLLHYSSLLEDFRKSVFFVLKTPNPVLDSERYDEKARELSRELLKKECHNLIMEIDRLRLSRDMQDKRLENVMHLLFSYVSIEDSKHMQALTEATVRDSAAMKQIAYLTMVFLPASFCAGLFGMNVKEVNPDAFGTVPLYVAFAVPFTLVTIWVVLAFHGQWHKRDEDGEVNLWTRLSWPFTALGRLIGERDWKKHIASRSIPWRSDATQALPKDGA